MKLGEILKLPTGSFYLSTMDIMEAIDYVLINMPEITAIIKQIMSSTLKKSKLKQVTLKINIQ